MPFPYYDRISSAIDTMALVDSRPYDEQLHGSIEMIEDRSQIPLVQSQEPVEKHSKDLETSKNKKADIVLVTVKPRTTSSSSSQSSVPQSRSDEDREGQHTSSTEHDQEPVIDPEASRRRYSVMMASLAAARVEESKAALAMQSRSHPSNSTGVPSETAIDGWKWQTRRELEDDFAMREKYLADEL